MRNWKIYPEVCSRLLSFCGTKIKFFQESNKICSDEARKRHQTEVSKKKVEEELEEMKAKAQIEREMLDSMRKKIDSVSKK